MGNSIRGPLVAGLTLTLVVCGGCADSAGAKRGSSASLSLPLVTPPVRAAAPPGLGGAANLQTARKVGALGRKLLALDSLDATDLKQRFFTAGPTSLFQILGAVDAQIAEINRSARGNDSACLTQEPVPYTLTPFGQSLDFYAQCFRSFGSATAPAFVQFGQKDGVTYLFSTGGVQTLAVRLTPAAAVTASDPDAGPIAGPYRVDAWIGIGYDNATRCGPMTGFDGCSYGAIELHSDEARRGFLLSVAGLGFGYCGAQLQSDGNSVYAVGSLDMGTTCVEPRSSCVAASDVTTPATCDAGLTTFPSIPLGRVATIGTSQAFGESKYPGPPNNQVVLNGKPTDSLAFGIAAPTLGVGELGGGSASGGGDPSKTK